MPIEDIAHDNNCSIASISRIAKACGALRKPNNTSSRDLNIHYFDNPDMTWIDFINQYGSIQSSKNLLSITVSLSLLSELESFRHEIGADNKKIYITEKYAQFQVSNPEFIQGLKEWIIP